MQPSAEFRTSSTALLTVFAAQLSYAVPSACVLGIERLRDWQGEPPLDVLRALGLPAAAPDADEARVAVLDAGERRLALLVRGALSLLHPAPDELLPLPAAMQSLTPLITHIAVVGGKASLFVLSPARLARAQPMAPSPSLPIASR